MFTFYPKVLQNTLKYLPFLLIMGAEISFQILKWIFHPLEGFRAPSILHIIKRLCLCQSVLTDVISYVSWFKKHNSSNLEGNDLRSFKPFVGHMDLASAWFSVFQSLCFLKVQCSPALLKGESVCGNLLQFSRSANLPLLFFFFFLFVHPWTLLKEQCFSYIRAASIRVYSSMYRNVQDLEGDYSNKWSSQ